VKPEQASKVAMRLILVAIVGHARPMPGAGYGEEDQWWAQKPATFFTAAASPQSHCARRAVSK